MPVARTELAVALQPAVFLRCLWLAASAVAYYAGRWYFDTLSIEANATLTMNGGTNMTNTISGITNAGTININGYTTLESDITNNNVVNWNAGGLYSTAGSTLTNNDTLNILAFNATPVEWNFVNSATGDVIKTGAAGQGQTIPTSFNNT